MKMMDNETAIKPQSSLKDKVKVGPDSVLC